MQKLVSVVFQKLFPETYARSPQLWWGVDAYHRLHHAIEAADEELLKKIARPNGNQAHRVEAVSHITDQTYLMDLFLREKEQGVGIILAKIIEDQAAVLDQLKSWRWGYVKNMFTQMPLYNHAVGAKEIPIDSPRFSIDQLGDVLGVNGFLRCLSCDFKWGAYTLDSENGFQIELSSEFSGVSPKRIFTLEHRTIYRLAEDAFTYIEGTKIDSANPGDLDWELS